ncbi:MAG: FkbM family methyltransferase [Lacisediminihabitans sp.]
MNRALADIETGRYVDVGANHPQDDSVSRSFYNRGWSGIAIEPNPFFSSQFRAERPRDMVIEAAMTDLAEPTATFHLVDGTGLSTLVDSISARHVENGYSVTDLTVPTMRLDTAIEQSGLSGTDVHFLVIDTEGAEEQVLRSIDFNKHRPWILVIEATSPETTTASHDSWEDLVLGAGYEFCLFDGLSRYYVSREKSVELKPALSYPACVFDSYITAREQRLRSELEAAQAELTGARERTDEAERALSSFTRSRSWQITRPLRSIRRRLGPR